MSAYTDYIQGYIGNLSGTFGWGQETLDFILDEALTEYGVDTEAEATDTKKAHALLRFKTVERMLMDYAGDHDYKTDGESFSRNQVPERFREMWLSAKREAMPYLSTNRITISALDTGFNPMKRSNF